MSKHTPGPYTLKAVRQHFEVVSKKQKLARLFVYSFDPGEAFATGQLFSASPDLLDGCKVALRALRAANEVLGEEDDYLDEIQALIAAIDKAEGRG